MACDKCGARRGHAAGCPTQAAGRQTAGRKKGHGSGLLKGEKEHTCRDCSGKGTITRHYQDKKGKWQEQEITCRSCGGTGRIDE